MPRRFSGPSASSPRLQRSRAAFLFGALLAAAAPAQTIFVDGFETGSLCAWSSQVGGPAAYVEAFDGPDGSPWPAPWSETGSVALADLQGDRARFRPTPSAYSLARLDAPIETRDVEVRFTLVFEDVASQGVGFYVRHNGGYLQQTTPPGEGYAVFVEGFRGTPGIGVWHELDGVESPIESFFDDALGFEDGVPYRVRFRAQQVDAASTRLQAKVWPLGQPEPAGWQVDTTDSAPQLQAVSGGIALDSWSSVQAPGTITAHTLIDDVEVEGSCAPPAGAGSRSR